MNLKVGDVISFERTFTEEDVELFTKVSWDEGTHHVTPDEQGRLVIQGLLTATLPTKIGGEQCACSDYEFRVFATGFHRRYDYLQCDDRCF